MENISLKWGGTYSWQIGKAARSDQGYGSDSIKLLGCRKPTFILRTITFLFKWQTLWNIYPNCYHPKTTIIKMIKKNYIATIFSYSLRTVA